MVIEKIGLVLADAQGCAIQLVGGTTCLLVTSSCVLALLKTKSQKNFRLIEAEQALVL